MLLLIFFYQNDFFFWFVSFPFSFPFSLLLLMQLHIEYIELHNELHKEFVSMDNLECLIHFDNFRFQRRSVTRFQTVIDLSKAHGTFYPWFFAKVYTIPHYYSGLSQEYLLSDALTLFWTLFSSAWIRKLHTLLMALHSLLLWDIQLLLKG